MFKFNVRLADFERWEPRVASRNPKTRVKNFVPGFVFDFVGNAKEEPAKARKQQFIKQIWNMSEQVNEINRMKVFTTHFITCGLCSHPVQS